MRGQAVEPRGRGGEIHDLIHGSLGFVVEEFLGSLLHHAECDVGLPQGSDGLRFSGSHFVCVHAADLYSAKAATVNSRAQCALISTTSSPRQGRLQENFP